MVVVMTNARIILTTAGSQKKPARSLTPWWSGDWRHASISCRRSNRFIAGKTKWRRQKEWLLLIKTQAELFERVRDTVKELHSYDLPECVMLDLTAGTPDYLDWIANAG